MTTRRRRHDTKPASCVPKLELLGVSKMEKIKNTSVWAFIIFYKQLQEEAIEHWVKHRST